jgi:hypothetical protein
VVLAVLLPLVGLPAWYWANPQRPVWEMERRLRRGEKVTLIDETGGPRWSRWGIRQGMTNPALLQDGAFSIAGLDYTVLTLLPDPQRSYRLRAEVRHERVSEDGGVGLAFLHSRHDTPPEKKHCLCLFTFNDLEARFPDPGNGKMSSRIELRVLYVPESRPDGAAAFGPDRGGVCFQQHFVPAEVKKPREYPWRRLAVEVRPEGVDLFWKEEHLAHIPHETILQRFRKATKGGRMVDPLPDLHPAFSPRDAIGLFVTRGQASFKRVEVEPLPEP